MLSPYIHYWRLPSPASMSTSSWQGISGTERGFPALSYPACAPSVGLRLDYHLIVICSSSSRDNPLQLPQACQICHAISRGEGGGVEGCLCVGRIVRQCLLLSVQMFVCQMQIRFITDHHSHLASVPPAFQNVRFSKESWQNAKDGYPFIYSFQPGGTPPPNTTAETAAAIAALIGNSKEPDETDSGDLTPLSTPARGKKDKKMRTPGGSLAGAADREGEDVSLLPGEGSGVWKGSSRDHVNRFRGAVSVGGSSDAGQSEGGAHERVWGDEAPERSLLSGGGMLVTSTDDGASSAASSKKNGKAVKVPKAERQAAAVAAAAARSAAAKVAAADGAALVAAATTGGKTAAETAAATAAVAVATGSRVAAPAVAAAPAAAAAGSSGGGSSSHVAASAAPRSRLSTMSGAGAADSVAITIAPDRAAAPVQDARYQQYPAAPAQLPQRASGQQSLPPPPPYQQSAALHQGPPRRSTQPSADTVIDLF